MLPESGLDGAPALELVGFAEAVLEEVRKHRLQAKKSLQLRMWAHEAPVGRLLQHLCPAPEGQLGEQRLRLERRRVLRQELRVEDTAEGRQAGEQVLRVGREIAVGVLDAAQDALGLALGAAGLERGALLQRCEHRGRWLPGEIGQHHLERQRKPRQELEQVLELLVVAVRCCAVALQDVLGQQGRRLGIEPCQLMHVVLERPLGEPRFPGA